jgi:RNA polymerase sigma factor (sigma-70 family)
MSQANDLLRHLRTNGLRLRAETESDGQLLDRFLASRSEEAFEGLLARLGPMVWSVCRRMLLNETDAEDAFQATFLVLVRKGRTVNPRDRVGNWLYGVAYCAARKARVNRARRREKEHRAATMAETLSFDPEPTSDLAACIDRELSRLPAKYRAPVVLCDLQGKTREEAARHLGWPEGTVAGRLSRARGLLARKLGKYSLAVTPAAVAATLTESVGAHSPPTTVLLAARQAVLEMTVLPCVLELMDGVIRSMQLRKVQVVVLGLVVVVAAGGLAAPFVIHPPEPKANPVVVQDERKEPPAPVIDPLAELRTKFAGRWQVDAGVRNGQTLTAWEKRGYLLDFGADGIVTIHRGQVRDRRAYSWQIDPATPVREVVLTPPDGNTSEAVRVAFELKDEKLTLSWDESSARGRTPARGGPTLCRLELSRLVADGGTQGALTVTPAAENVVGSRLVGEWRPDPELSKRLGDKGWANVVLTIAADPKVAADVPDAYRPMFAGKRIYMAGRMQVQPEKGETLSYSFLLVEHLGNPMLIYFLPEGPNVCASEEAVTVMLAPAANRKDDLLSITAFDTAKHAPAGVFRRAVGKK